MDNKLFVGNLAWAATEEDLSQVFSQFGTVETVEVLRDKFTNRARGFAFVTMATGEDALNCVTNLEGKDFMGRPLKVNVARPREEGAPRRSFGGPREGGFGGGQGGGGFRGPREGGFGGGQRSGGFGGGERRSFGGDRGGFGGGQGGFGGGQRSGGFGGGQGGFGGGQGGQGGGGYRFKPKPRRDFGGDEG